MEQLNFFYDKNYRAWVIQVNWHADDFLLSTETDDLLNTMQQWCVENSTGKRMSYDKFHFKTEPEASAFMLRWS